METPTYSAGHMSDIEQQSGAFWISATERPFTNLVALDVRWPGNRLGKRFPLNLLLEVEEHHLSIPIKPSLLQRVTQELKGQTDAADPVVRLRVRLRHCYVRYRSNEVEIISDSKYRCVTIEGKFDLLTSEKSSALTQSQHGVRLGARLGLKQTEVGASVDAQANAAFARQATRRIEATTTSQPDIYEVEAVPNGWRIGHRAYGDPNKLWQCLDGRYFRRPVPGYDQTCLVEFRRGCKRATLTFVVTVRDGLHVERMDGGAVSKGEATKAESAMRDRIAAIRLERHLGMPDDEGSADEEIPIATVNCEIECAADEVT